MVVDGWLHNVVPQNKEYHQLMYYYPVSIETCLFLYSCALYTFGYQILIFSGINFAFLSLNYLTALPDRRIWRLLYGSSMIYSKH